ncbi:MAG: cysteine--tRNA ligase [Gammaproteobacteria bacterium]|nr:cysteine--tRNA ligase [Gammaproteobacteria bacterium]
MLKIYNTLTRSKQAFTPIQDGVVRMYVCGMTVYDYCHVGHARVLVAFDVVRRYLASVGYKVVFVRNITDIDDKIIVRAEQNGESMADLTGRFIDAMHEDSEALMVLPPDIEPRATDSMRQIIDMIQALCDKGYAYQAANGDVYYRVERFAEYGRLSGKQLEDLRAGARVEVDEAKEDPLDFVLWKSAKPGEPSWPSPWGDGRPGWHIECSAMSVDNLGPTFDIHGGGMDLQFPHHENEIAQACAATGESFAKVWMHNGFVQINEEKMSKSLGNFFTVRQVLEHYDGEVVRYFILASHYRSPLNYADTQLDNARAALERFYIALRGIEASGTALDDASLGEFRARFNAAMDDDFNTPVALEVLFDLARATNRARQSGDDEQARILATGLRELGGILGILQRDPEQFLQGGQPGDDDAEIDDLIRQRAEARAAKNWVEADRIRKVLDEKGILLEDGAGGTTWRRG